MLFSISTVPQTQPAPSAPPAEHANGKQSAPQPVPTSIPASIQDYKGSIFYVIFNEVHNNDYILFLAPVTASVTTPVSAPELTTRSLHQHTAAPPVMSQMPRLGNYYPYK